MIMTLPLLSAHRPRTPGDNAGGIVLCHCEQFYGILCRKKGESERSLSAAATILARETEGPADLVEEFVQASFPTFLPIFFCR